MDEKKDKKLNSTATYLLVLAVVIFLCAMLYQIYHLKQKAAAYDAKEAALQIEYEEETQRAEEIDALSDYMKTNQYIEDTAKSKLGLAYEDEIIFKEQK